MQFLKTGLFLMFTILFLQSAQSQNSGEWSSWKSDQVFEELEMRYKKIEKEDDRYFYEIECRNRFSHNLTYFLVFDQISEKRKFIKLKLGENEKVNIKPEFSLDPEGLNIHTFYASLTPTWPVEAR
ncbi:hypothetical protein [Gramella sp. KN1008]|uniref:hypothetical protein n=1 Tax=Gramella sp. KN1008 TaxID=2529298 RepID=UPI0010402924|nr:hypothetical protein [Gramella sp. KN1008]TBW28251.1 hypothetical protein EZJ28_05760 [Gramella sp. KN1008]